MHASRAIRKLARYSRASVSSFWSYFRDERKLCFPARPPQTEPGGSSAALAQTGLAARCLQNSVACKTLKYARRCDVRLSRWGGLDLWPTCATNPKQRRNRMRLAMFQCATLPSCMCLVLDCFLATVAPARPLWAAAAYLCCGALWKGTGRRVDLRHHCCVWPILENLSKRGWGEVSRD